MAAGKISPVKIDAAEDVLGAGMTRIAGDDGLGEMVGLADITSAEPGFRGIDGDVGIGGGEFQSFVQFASGFIKARFGDRKIGELAEAKSDGLVVVALGFGEVAGGERGLGGFKTALEKNGGIVGGTGYRSRKRQENGEENDFRDYKAAMQTLVRMACGEKRRRRQRAGKKNSRE